MGQRRQPQGQLFGGRDLVTDQVGQGNLGGGDQPAAVLCVEQVLGELLGAEVLRRLNRLESLAGSG